MTVSTEACYAERAWTGIETSFAPGFPAMAMTDLVVRHRAGSARTVLTLDQHYAVALAADTGMVTVTPIALPNAPAVIEFERVTPATQQQRFRDDSRYSEREIERLGDRFAMRAAEMRRSFGIETVRNNAQDLRFDGIDGQLDVHESRLGVMEAAALGGAVSDIRLAFMTRGALTPWDFQHLVTGGRVAVGEDDTPAFLALAAQYTVGRAVYIPDLGSPYLISQTITWNPPASYNFLRRRPPAVVMEPTATIRAIAPMVRMFMHGGIDPDFSTYLRDPEFHLGTLDCNFLAERGFDAPHYIDLTLNVYVKNALKRYVSLGDRAAPSSSAAVKGRIQTNRDVEPFRFQVTSITNAPDPIATGLALPSTWPDVGGRGVVHITDGAWMVGDWATLNGRFIEVLVTGPDSVQLLNVDTTGFGAWSGIAQMYLNMPCMRVPQIISDVSNSELCEIKFEKPHRMTSGQTYLIADAGNMPHVDGEFIVTVVDDETITIPLDTRNTLYWGEYNPALGKGCALEHVPDEDMLFGVWCDNSSDIDDCDWMIRGVRVGVGYYTHGWDGKKAHSHFWNLPEQGEILAAYYLGGNNVLVAPQIDGPFHWVGRAWGPDNHSFGTSVNYGGLAGFDGVACMWRLEMGASMTSHGDSIKGYSGKQLLKEASGPGTFYTFGSSYHHIKLPHIIRMPGLPVAQVLFEPDGTLISGFNVASVTRNGGVPAGDFIVAFNGPVPLDCPISGSVQGLGSFTVQEEISWAGRTEYQRRLMTEYNLGLTDPDRVSFTWFLPL